MSEFKFEIVESLPSIKRNGAGGSSLRGRNAAILEALLANPNQFVNVGPVKSVAGTVKTLQGHVPNGTVKGSLRKVEDATIGFLTYIPE